MFRKHQHSEACRCAETTALGAGPGIWDTLCITSPLVPANLLSSPSPGLLGNLTQYDHEERKTQAFAGSLPRLPSSKPRWGVAPSASAGSAHAGAETTFTVSPLSEGVAHYPMSVTL